MGAVSIVLYVVMNYLSNGTRSSRTRCRPSGVWIAFYYGLTGFACVWYYRKTLPREPAQPLAAGHPARCSAGLMLWFAMGWSFWYYWNPVNSYTTWTLPGRTGTSAASSSSTSAPSCSASCSCSSIGQFRPAYFRGEVLNRDTPTRVPEDIGVPVGLFGIEPFDESRGRRPRQEPTGAG